MSRRLLSMDYQRALGLQSKPTPSNKNDAHSAAHSTFPGAEYLFNCFGPTGAILALPHGAHLDKLENLESMRRYAAQNAESWYKYANGTRGRGLVNGSLYLVTGCEKAKSWGMTLFQDVMGQSEFQLAFKPSADADSGHNYRWHRSAPGRQKHKDAPVIDGNPLNQTTFVHAFTISLGEGIWGKLFGSVEICQLENSQFFPGCVSVPYRAEGSSPAFS
jgi:hypothetical protein